MKIQDFYNLIRIFTPAFWQAISNLGCGRRSHQTFNSGEPGPISSNMSFSGLIPTNMSDSWVNDVVKNLMKFPWPKNEPNVDEEQIEGKIGEHSKNLAKKWYQ